MCFSALLFSSSAGAAALAAGAPGPAGGYGGHVAPSGRSSGRSSNCDEHEMQSDVSLEEDVNELNQKVGNSSAFLLAGYLNTPPLRDEKASIALCIFLQARFVGPDSLPPSPQSPPD